MATSSDFITLGGGKLYMQRIKDGALTGDMEYFGLTDEISLKTDKEEIEHENTEGAVKTVDKKVVKKQTATLSFTTSEISPDMLALAFWGEKGEINAVTTGSYENVVVNAPIETGAYGGNITLKSGTKTLVLGTDFTFTPKDGVLTIIDGTNVTANKVTATFTNTKKRAKVEAFVNTAIEAKLVFISDANVGKSFKYTFHKTSISQSGEFVLKGDDWLTLNFEGEVLKDDSQTSGSQFFSIEEIG